VHLRDYGLGEIDCTSPRVPKDGVEYEVTSTLGAGSLIFQLDRRRKGATSALVTRPEGFARRVHFKWRAGK